MPYISSCIMKANNTQGAITDISANTITGAQPGSKIQPKYRCNHPEQ